MNNFPVKKNVDDSKGIIKLRALWATSLMDYFFYIPQAQGSALQCLLRLAAFAKGNWQVTTQDILALNKFIS